MAIDIAHIKQGLKMPSARDVAFDFDAESDSATFAEMRGKAGHELKDSTTGWSVEGALAPASIATGAVNATGNVTVGPVGSPVASITAATGALDTAGAATVDTINEHTTNAGVTVEGVLLKDSNMLSGAALWLNCGLNPADHTGTEWAWSATCPGISLPQNSDSKVAWGRTHGLTVGSVITGLKIGGVYTETTGVTVTARLYKYTFAAGSVVETAVGDSVTLTKDTGVISGSHTLASPETVADDAQYAVKITGTTQATDTVTIGCCHLGVKQKV